ncbi:hypothetical protein CLU79DRAFT_66381 [Phycomyces nitens]|nr:hypothetical protein CLU79DRAFT_66381 [Phycomyces nitens]
MYLGNLARDKSNPVPVQPGCSAVLAVFMFIATFVINYVRIKLPKANFACINACIQTTMALTQASIIPGFYPLLIWTFLKPIALAGGLSLAVNYLIWPDDSVTNYMLTLKKTLLDCKTFVKEHSDAFLATSIGELETTLPTILSKIQGDVLMLIDSKRAVQREIVYSRLSAQDLSNVTRIVKGLRPTIHGIGLSWVLKKKYYSEKQDNENENLDAEFEKLLQSIQSMQPACESLVDASQKALTQCIDSLDHFHRFVRTTLNSILWPFPRFFYSGNIKARKQQHIEMTTPSTCPSEKLQQSINQFDEMAGDRLEYFRNIYRGGSSSEHRSLYLIYLYQYNIRENALCTLKLIKYMEELEQTRPGRRLWFPHMTIKKWFQSPDVDANIGGDANNYGEMNQQQGMTLVRTATRQDLTVSSANGEKRSVTKKVNGRVYVRDADVEAPTTIRERFFYWTQSVSDWLFETDTVFAFKTAAGVVFGAIPCYMASQASWYFAWHGQWALITLVLWMTPMTGMFNFSLALKIIGTILGGILGIVIWEITQGNPYGLVVVCFIVFLPLYHIFFYGSTLRIVALMTKVTMILILVYEYDFHHFNPANMDPVWTLAGKRVLLVLIGIVASYILMIIPYPVIGRVELRKRLSQTIYDIEKSYGIVNATLMRASRGKARTEAQEKSFRQFSLAIRRQIEDERMFLLLSAFEPPLRGKFPKDSYAKILGSVDNMSGLIQGMVILKNIDNP